MSKRLLAAVVLTIGLPFTAHAAISVSIDIAPPGLPVYAQPIIPAPGYLWTPGYWRWSAADADYFWVPGTWVAPPYVGALWTPGYWGWGAGGYTWHGGYWGTHIGFYGGVNYGFGYIGHGYQGGYWNGGAFNYNRSVNNINTTIVHNVYNTTVVDNPTHVSFNGGQGGIAAQPTAEERAARAEQHTPPTALQRQHEQVALHTTEQRLSVNRGAPTLVATAHPGEMHAQQGRPFPGHAQGPAVDRHHAPGAEHAHAPHAGAPHGERHEGRQDH